MSATQKKQTWIRLKIPPQRSRSLLKLGKTVYFEEDEGESIAFMLHNKGLVKYNLDRQEIIKEYLLDPNIETAPKLNKGMATIDHEKRIVHLIDPCGEILSFDIENEKFHHDIPQQGLTIVMSMFWISWPVNELCIHRLNDFPVRVDMENKKFIVIEGNGWGMQGDSRRRWIPVERQNPRQLFWFKDDTDRRLLFGDISTSRKTLQPMIWKRYPNQLPNNGWRWKVVLAFDCLLFAFSDRFKGGYVLDLSLNDSAKWVKISMNLPNCDDQIAENEWIENMVLDNKNNIHLINLRSSSYSGQPSSRSPAHFKASAFDLIPFGIIKANRKKYDPLIVGFVKEIEKKNRHLNVPLYLQKLILKFYPIYV